MSRKTFSEFCRHCAQHGDAGMALVVGRLPPGEWTPGQARLHLARQNARGIFKSLLNEAAERYQAEDGYEELPEPAKQTPTIKTVAEMRAEGEAAVDAMKRAGGHVTDAGTLVLPDDEGADE